MLEARELKDLNVVTVIFKEHLNLFTIASEIQRWQLDESAALRASVLMSWNKSSGGLYSVVVTPRGHEDRVRLFCSPLSLAYICLFNTTTILG